MKELDLLVGDSLTFTSTPFYLTRFPKPNTGLSTFTGFSDALFRDVLEAYQNIGSNAPTEFQNRLDLLLKSEVTPFRNEHLELLKVEKNFLFKKALNASQRSATAKMRLRKVVFPSARTAELHYDHWRFTLGFSEDTRIVGGIRDVPHQIDEQGREVLALMARFITEKGDEAEQGFDTAYVDALSYKDNAVCPCMSKYSRNFQACCKPNLFASKDAFLGVGVLPLHDYITPAIQQHPRESFFEADYLAAMEKFKNGIQTKIKNKKPVPGIFAYLMGFEVPKVLDNEPWHSSFLHKAHAIRNNQGIAATVFAVYDANGILVELAGDPASQKQLLVESIRNNCYEWHFEEIQNAIERVRSRRPQYYEEVLKWVERSAMPNAAIKTRVSESVRLAAEGRFESACYVLGAQLEPLVRLACLKAYGADAVVEYNGKAKISRQAMMYPLLRDLIKKMPAVSKHKEQNTSAWKDMLIQTLCNWGMNLRNNLFHGFEDRGYLEKDYDILFYFLLYLEACYRNS